MKKFVSLPALLIYAAAATVFIIIKLKRRNENYA